MILAWLWAGCGGAEAPVADAPAAPTTPAAPTAEPAAPPVVSALPRARAHTHHTKVEPPVLLSPMATMARARLVEIVAQAKEPAHPWMVAHHVLAMGADDSLVAATMAQVQADHSFARTEGAETHTDLLVKNLLEAGVDPDRAWDTPQGPVTVGDVWQAALARGVLDPATQRSAWTSPGDMGWSLQAFADAAPTRPLRWQAEGATMDLDTLTLFVARVLHRESQFIVDTMAQKAPLLREGQPLYALPCGGAHLTQGLLWAVAEGFGGPEARTEAALQVRLWAWRVPQELAQVEALRRDNPEQADALRLQELKLLGHALETFAKARALGVAQGQEVEAATSATAAALASVVVTLPASLPPDAIGDAAHALRGLDLATGARPLDW